jgi:SAM-dependent methyltransferase
MFKNLQANKKTKTILKWLSYLMPISIEQTKSQFNPSLEVKLIKGRYQLCTPNVIYSYGDLYDNFSKSFDQIQLDNHKIQNVLILGFGLGSIPFMLEKRYAKNHHYTAIEIDNEVIRLAKYYVTDHLNAKIDYICTDANQYVFNTPKKYDLICMDVFIDDLVPTELESIKFLQQLKTLIQPQTGLLMFNKLSSTKKEKEQSTTFYKNTFLQVFPQGRYLDVDGNYMLLNH